jgi:hypothetical protein
VIGGDRFSGKGTLPATSAHLLKFILRFGLKSKQSGFAGIKVAGEVM